MTWYWARGDSGDMTGRFKHYWTIRKAFASRRSWLRAVWTAVVRGYRYEICRSCGRPVGLVWWAQQNIWDAVVGDRTTLRCIPCFNREAEAEGIIVRFDVHPL